MSFSGIAQFESNLRKLTAQGNWHAPDRSRITIDETHALMDAYTFNELPEYSATKPTGVYDGKMWRRHNGLFDVNCPAKDRRWMLMWYGPCGDPNKCSVNSRLILIA